MDGYSALILILLFSIIPSVIISSRRKKGKIMENTKKEDMWLEDNRIEASVDFEWQDDLNENHYRVIVDKNNRTMYIFSGVKDDRMTKIPFNEVIGFEIYTDDQISGGIGRAIMGSAIAGGVGAIVGASTGRKRKIVSYKGILYRENFEHPSFTFTFIRLETSVDAIAYSRAKEFAEKISAVVKTIISSREREEYTGGKDNTRGIIAEKKETIDAEKSAKKTLDTSKYVNLHALTESNPKTDLIKPDSRINRQSYAGSTDMHNSYIKQHDSVQRERILSSNVKLRQYVDAPIRINSVTLYANADKEYGRIVFFNQSKSVVIGIIVRVNAYNIARERVNIPKDRYIFQDMFVGPGEEYGSKETIPLADDVRIIDLLLEKVVFKDGNVWDSNNEVEAPGFRMEETVVEREIKSSVIESLKSHGIFGLRYYYEEDENAWLCTCGKVNSHENERCSFCNSNKLMQSRLLSREGFAQLLDGIMSRRIEEENNQIWIREATKRLGKDFQREEEELERQERIEKHIRKRNRNRKIWIVFFVVLIIFIGWQIFRSLFPIPYEKLYYKIVSDIAPNIIEKRILCYDDGIRTSKSIMFPDNKWYRLSDDFSVRFDGFRLADDYDVIFLYTVKISRGNEEYMYSDTFHGDFSPSIDYKESLVSIYNVPKGHTYTENKKYKIDIVSQYINKRRKRENVTRTFTFNMQQYYEYFDRTSDNTEGVVCFTEGWHKGRSSVQKFNQGWVISEDRLIAVRLNSVETMDYPMVKLNYSFGYFADNNDQELFSKSVEADLSGKIPQDWFEGAGISIGRKVVNVTYSSLGEYRFSLPVYVFYNGRCIDTILTMTVSLGGYEEMLVSTFPPIATSLPPENRNMQTQKPTSGSTPKSTKIPTSKSTHKPSSRSATCSMCGRSWEPGDKDGNFMRIALSSMCNECYANYKEMKALKEALGY